MATTIGDTKAPGAVLTEAAVTVIAERDALLLVCEALVHAGYKQVYDAVECKFCGRGEWGGIPINIRHDSGCPVGMAEDAIDKMQRDRR